MTWEQYGIALLIANFIPLSLIAWFEFVAESESKGQVALRLATLPIFLHWPLLVLVFAVVAPIAWFASLPKK